MVMPSPFIPRAAFCINRAAMMTTAAVAKSMKEDGAFYSTYGWHPRSVGIAIRTLRYLIRNEKRLLRDVALVDWLLRK